MSLELEDQVMMNLDKSSAYQSISLLPDEMIRYELETQGIKSADHISKRRSQLAEHILNRRYKNNRQPVAMGLKEDIGICKHYCTAWEKELAASTKSTLIIRNYLIKVQFLERRVENLAMPIDNEDLAKELSYLKKDVQLLASHLRLASIQDNPTEAATLASDTILEKIENWSMHEVQHQNIPQSSPVQDFFNKYKSGKSVEHKSMPIVPNNSILDTTLELYNARGPIRGTNRTSGNFTYATQRPLTFSTSNSYLADDSSSYRRNKPKIWEWGVKFRGDSTISVAEFILRIKELAKSRGATDQDLMNSAVDLFDGDALPWFRAGVENNLFSCWRDLKERLIADFEKYDYVDDLFEHIKNRLQEPNERIVTYFAIMEDLFLKLSRPINEGVKVKIIRRNLRTEFIQGLGIQVVHTVYELKMYCKDLESNFLRIKSRPQSRDSTPSSRQVRFSDRVNSLESLNPRDYEYGNDSVENNITPLDRIAHQSRPSYPKINQDHSSRSQFNRNRSSSPSWKQDNHDNFDRRMQELSVREDPKLPIYSVPPPRECISSDQGDQRYFAPARLPQKDLRPQGLNYGNSGNGQGRYLQRTPDMPRVVKRPSYLS